jgi:hypothetical protein
MKRAVLFMVGVMCCLQPALAQSVKETVEEEVVANAVRWQSERPQPYLRRWTVLSATETASSATCRAADLSHTRASSGIAPDIWKEVIDDFAARNEEPARRDHAVLEGATLADLSGFRLRDGYDWIGIRHRFPAANAVIEVCRPGFSRAGSIALVRTLVTKYQDGPLSSAIILRKTDGAWEIAATAVGE